MLLNQTFRNQWNHHEEKTERHCSIESNFQTEAIHLRFDLNFDYCLAKKDWKREFFEIMERSKRTISGGGPLWPVNFHLGRSVLVISWSWPKIQEFWHNGKQPTLQSLVKGAISGEEKKGMEKLAKVFLPGVVIRDDNCYLKSVYYNSEHISLHSLKLSRNRQMLWRLELYILDKDKHILLKLEIR